MRPTKAVSWVVYETVATGKTPSMQAVCEQSDWDRMRKEFPLLKLVQEGIQNEAVADQIARRATVGLDSSPKKYR